MGQAELKIPHGLIKKLDKVAKETSKTTSYHLSKALREYLEDYELGKIALKRLKDKNDKFITLEELKKALGL
jgi:predicted DNA-binding protein